MHENNIESLRKEALRLIKMEQKLFAEMLASEGVITEGDKNSRQTFDRSSAERAIETLAGEATKLEHLDMVLAVVGTMKAGKSTTINAIVGAEVVPNRSQPMTALPTLIRHTPGQTEPLLKFDNNAPLQRLMEELRKRIASKKYADQLSEAQESQKELRELVARVESGENIGNLYKGSGEISNFLTAINDLVRLSPIFDIDFPFSDYDGVDELPVIEIEFLHLKGMDAAQGRLTLLDTPGPNEAGQMHLRTMLKDQLQKASAVLAVMDFQQLKSDADETIRENLLAIEQVAGDRIYILVNRFDMRQPNDMDENDVKMFIKNRMNGIVDQDRVYPVSSKKWFLANMARSSLSAEGKLPDPDSASWVQVFGDMAFGPRWFRYINDPVEVEEIAAVLCKESNFDAPLQNVIRTAHANAAILALSSAASKLDDNAERTQNLLETRHSAMQKETKELESLIKNIQSDIDKVGEAENLATNNARASMKSINKEIQQAFKGFRDQVEAAVDGYFDEGKSMVAAAKKTKAAKRLPTQGGFLGKYGALAALLGVHQANADPTVDFDPNSTLLQFDTRSDAVLLIEKIQRSLTEIMGSAEADIVAIVNDVMQRFKYAFDDEVIAASRKIIDQTRTTLEKEGFNISLSIPPSATIRLNISSLDVIEKSIRSKTKTETYSRRQKGAWGKVCSWFGTTDWGWEEYEEEVEFFEVDIKKIRKTALKNVDSILADLNENIVTQIKQPLDEAMETVFTDLKAMIERIRGDLIQGMKDQQLSQDKKGKLLKSFTGLKNKATSSKKDSGALQKEVKLLAPQAD